MEEFCPFCNIASYYSFCMCTIDNEICGMVRRCPTEQRYKPLQNMPLCKIRKEYESMNKNKFKVRFEKHGILYIEKENYIITVSNPFDIVPEYVDDLVNIENVWYIKGYEPIKKVETNKNNLKEKKIIK